MRILNVVPTTNIASGIMHYIMDYFITLSKKSIIFDFVIIAPNTKNNFNEKIRELGGTVYTCEANSVKNIFQYQKKLNLFFSNNNFCWDAIYVHVLQLSKFFLREAAKRNCPVVLHSHNPKLSDSWLKNLRNKLMMGNSSKHAKFLLSCSEESGLRVFGKSFLKKGRVIPNAINYESFKFNPMARQTLREQLNISPSTIVIGNVGRLVKQKNQKYFIQNLKHFDERFVEYLIVIVGDGPEKSNLEKSIPLEYKKRFLFIPSTNLVSEYYSMFDIFVLPSLYEGFGIVALEAQANGLPTFISSSVPESVIVCDNVHKLSDLFVLNTHRTNINKNNNWQTFDINYSGRLLETTFHNLFNK